MWVNNLCRLLVLNFSKPTICKTAIQPLSITTLKQDKLTLKTTFKIIASFIGAALLVTLVSTALFGGFGEIEKSAEARKHTFTVINHANQLLSALKDAETGQRGYSLTGDEAFLEPYLAVRDSIGGDLEQLRQLTSGSATHQYVETIAPLIDAKLAELAKVIELRRNHDSAGVLALVSSGQGKQFMDKIRAEVNTFTQTEEVALAQNETTFQSNMRRLFMTIVTACLLVLLLAFSFAYLVYRQTKQRLQNLIHLETQHSLEIQEELNAQLQQTNATLQVSEERLSVTLSSIGDAVITTNAEACITLLNPLAEQLTGWTQEEANGRSVDEVFHIVNKDTRLLATIPVFETLTCGTIQGLANHTVLIARDGSEYDIADSCAPIRDRDAQVIGAILVFRDVTKEYVVQQTLRDSAAQIQTILNTVVDSIITIRATDGIIETANPATEKMFGCITTAELLGQNVSILMFESEQTPRNNKSFLDDCIINDEIHPSGREVLGRRMDGSTFPMEIAISEMWLNGQRYFTGILRDITARKFAEKVIFETDALQNAIFNSATFSSIATDAKGVIQIFNVGAERMLGYTANEVINKMSPAELSDSQEMIARAQTLSNEFGTPITAGFEALVFKAARGIEDIYELTYLRKDGSCVPAVVSVTALRDAHDIIIGYLLIGTDNTTRKAIEVKQKILEQSLRDHQFYTRSLFEANIDALITTDPSGVITDVNKQMEILTGCTRDELIGSPFKNYFTDLEAAETGIKLVLTHKKLTNYELTARAIDGKEIIVSFNATTFYDRNRQLQGVFAAARDITERKRLDQVLQDKNVELEVATLMAEKANLAKSDFLSSMSHELRDPLTAILGFAQLMESDFPPPSPQTERIMEILRAGWHLLALINDILDLTTIESGHVSISEETVLLSEVMEECQNMMELQAQQRSITLTFPVFSTACFIRADRTRLKQVITNLISNAIKYNRPEGAVIVSCTVDSVTEFTRISITDTGIGLSPEKIAQLFQRFNRLGQEFSGVSGTGIGLVVVKRLVELMHGVIGVESTVDVGSVFWVEFPSVAAPYLSVESDIAVLVTPQSLHIAGQHTVLYIDDNPVNLKLIGQILDSHSDISLLCELNATAGIEKARLVLPDVILMDINMPVINGFEALKILRADVTTAHIPVIAFSANAMPRDIKKGLEAGFFRYITKPIKVNEFITALDETLRPRV